MKVYVCLKTYFYEGNIIKEIFTDEIQAAICAGLNDYVIEEYEIKENIYNPNDYEMFTYYCVFYKNFCKIPIQYIEKRMGLKNHTEIDDEIYINSKGLSRCEIIASSAEEAADIFNNKYKELMDKFYIENDIKKQNGKIKTWKINKK
jgi:hypothetical protein